MTSFVFKSLMLAGAFLFFGGHLPMPEGRAGALPGFGCEADLGTCRLGEAEIAVGDRSPLLASLAERAKGQPLADLKRHLADPELVKLLDERVVSGFAVEAAERQVATIASHFIEGVATGRH
jgi:hypothetical protein